MTTTLKDTHVFPVAVWGWGLGNEVRFVFVLFHFLQIILELNWFSCQNAIKTILKIIAFFQSRFGGGTL